MVEKCEWSRISETYGLGETTLYNIIDTSIFLICVLTGSTTVKAREFAEDVSHRPENLKGKTKKFSSGL